MPTEGETMDRNANRLGAAAAALLLLILTPVSYTGAYLSLVTVSPSGEPEYRLGGKHAEQFFEPAHQVDVKVRKETWESDAAIAVVSLRRCAVFRPWPGV
jgi:hypothetical protein